MKNKSYIIFLLINFFYSTSFAEPFQFKSTDIKIEDQGNLIYASEGTAISDDKNIEIQAENFEYNQKLNLLKAFNGKAFVKSDDLEIKFNEIEIDKENSNLIYFNSAYEACEGASAIIIGTEWNEFRALNFKKISKILKEKIIFDLRNIYIPEDLKELGFKYYGTGK